jgi:hypothetical protein
VVDPKTGSDTTGNGSADKPFKTLTKAMAVVKASTTGGLTISLSPGQYTTANGEVFPVVVPTGVTIDGTGYGGGPRELHAAFVTGAGEDTAYEQIVGKTSTRTAFATLVIAPNVTEVQINKLYVGAASLQMPANASYAAVDSLGAFSASNVTFAAATGTTHANVGGVALPGGSLSCTACTLLGSSYALLAFTAQGLPPSIQLSGQPGQGIIGGTIGLLTDGTANVASSYQTYQSRQYGYRDSFVAPASTPGTSTSIATVDFGGGTQSAGGNVLIGAHGIISEIAVTTKDSSVSALANTWNPNIQGTNAHGQYAHDRIFKQGTRGKNVTVSAIASFSSVLVGPPVPPTSSPPPSGSPGPTTSPSPT